MKKVLFLGMLLAFLFSPTSSAFSQDVSLDNLRARCAQYGFKVGTEPFANCVMKLEGVAQRKEVCRQRGLAAFGASGAGGLIGQLNRGNAVMQDCLAGRETPNQQIILQDEPQQPTNCTTTVYHGQARTHCY